jgi:hypothetical protein
MLLKLLLLLFLSLPLQLLMNQVRHTPLGWGACRGLG